MRLIDGDKLIKDIEGLQDCYNGFSDAYDKACIIGVVDEQPTIERNETYNSMVKELLALEEQVQIFCMTKRERMEFQMYVEERLGI